MVSGPVERTDKSGAGINLPVPSTATLVESNVMGKSCVVPAGDIAGGRCCILLDVSAAALLPPRRTDAPGILWVV